MKDWKTTTVGILFAVASQIEPWIIKEQIPDTSIIILTIGFAIVSYLAADGKN